MDKKNNSDSGGLNPMNELVLNRIELQTIFGFDLGHLLNDEHENTFNSLRGNKKWLEKIEREIKLPQQYGFSLPQFVSSSYARTDRRERSTFSIYYNKTLMPLSFPILNDEPLFLSENISVKFQTIKIGINGSITLTSWLSYNGQGLSCDTFINIYNTNLSRIKENAYSIIKRFIEMLNLYKPTNLSFNQISFTEFDQFIYCFDVLDFDYSINKNKKIDIYDLCEDEDLLKQLTRIFRMSLNNYQNTDVSRIRRLLDDNIGYRRDELWLINENRIVRHYPEAKADNYKELFFKDVILGCEIFIQYKVALLYLNQWVITKYSRIKEAINSNKRSASENLNELEDIIFEMTNFINIFSDDFYVQMNIDNSFFNEIIEHLIEKLNLMSILNSNRHLLSSLLEQLSSISSIITADKSKTTNNAVWIITAIMAIIAFMQLIVTIMMMTPNKNDDCCCNPIINSNYSDSNPKQNEYIDTCSNSVINSHDLDDSLKQIK